MNGEFGSASFEWDGNGAPYSPQFDDVYFSKSGGFEETRHVFLHGNDLPERWRGSRRFTIGETGFGTGLNFLITWREWRESAPRDATLHFVSVEKHPVARDDLARFLEPQRELGNLAGELLSVYPLPLPGFHRLHLDGGRVFLTLLFGDVVETLRGMGSQPSGLVDAWYLDGFSPAKNPEMWTPEVFAEVARLSAANATFATFSSAGAVRRGLEDAGFDVEKVPGFAGKREMARGRLAVERPARESIEEHAVVVGAGLAGTCAAHALLRRGWRVTSIERHGGVAEEASGNPRGILMPYPTAVDDPRDRFYAAAFEYARRHVLELSPHDPDIGWRECGVLQLVSDERAQRRRDAMRARGLPEELIEFLDASRATELCGFPVRDPALWFSRGGTLSPKALCRANLSACGDGLTRRFGSGVLSIERDADGWRILGDGGAELGRAPTVVLATARETRDLLADPLPLRTVRGQLTLIPATEASRALRAVVHHDGYVHPACDGAHVVGATFDRGDENPAVKLDDHERNLAALGEALPELVAALGRPKAAAATGRTAFRATTPDHLPIAGEIADGLFVSTGHGSRGIVSATIAGELIATRASLEVPPMSSAECAALDPRRFG